MGTIQIKTKGISIKFERSEEEINKIFQQLSGGGTIEGSSTQLKLSPTEQKNETLKPLPKNQSNIYYPLSPVEIMEYIKSLPKYRHGVKSIISHFNKNEIDLNRKDKLLFSYWFGIRQKATIARRKIQKSEGGKWIEVRVSKGKEYYFEKI